MSSYGMYFTTFYGDQKETIRVLDNTS